MTRVTTNVCRTTSYGCIYNATANASIFETGGATNTYQRGKGIYTGNAWVKLKAGSGTPKVFLRLEELNASNVLQGKSDAAPVTLTSSYQRLTVSRTVTDPTRRVRLKVMYASGTSVQLYVDDAELKKATSFRPR